MMILVKLLLKIQQIYAKDMIFLVVVDIESFSNTVVNELTNCDILVTVYSGKNIPIKEAQNLWQKVMRFCRILLTT